MHFGECRSHLLPFCEFLLGPGNSPVEVQSEILDILFLRKVYVVYVDWKPGLSSCGEYDMGHLEFVSFILLSLTIFILRLGWFAVSVKQWLYHCLWLILQCRR
jgi:hypothetical protein